MVSGVTVNKYSKEKTTAKYHLLGNNYSPSTYLLINKYSIQEISAPLEIVSRVVFSTSCEASLLK